LTILVHVVVSVGAHQFMKSCTFFVVSLHVSVAIYQVEADIVCAGVTISAQFPIYQYIDAPLR